MNYKYLILLIFFVVVTGCWLMVENQRADFYDWNQSVVRHAIKEELEFVEIVQDNLEDVDEMIVQGEDKLVEVKIKDVLLEVPFTSQAPLAEWDNPVFQDGCEEAATLMAMSWVRGESLTSQEAQDKILVIARYQTDRYGEARDTAARDTITRIFNGYFEYNKVEVKKDIGVQDIVDELLWGNLVIVPTNGQLLGNPYYKSPGPERHNLVVRGYDSLTKEFITNDPGTKRGEGYRYNERVLWEAIRDYPSGYHVEIERVDKVMIVVER